ncbi:OmpA family protein [Chitinophaga pinensis]|uniref:OmpA/MotB domain protein n=1 Tax=Chitinophaga pinensis (strain ATCC 43595 / DSM 2588 / LMG 13176 / NBRC 15968 / NCIMB 11800 / UQM 2034) TaxID=485918 RepID=A0A979G9Q9_CHIPD|nr:OmpA family protein [Chitinophaga pinensis]ACU63297.1 OmpA/MotB domain protein [Chitinophaga pinensis DSM 2588]
MSRILSITFLFLSLTICLHAQQKVSIYFPFGSAELSDTAKQTLNTIPVTGTADLSGHTDTIGATTYNVQLAAARLKAVSVYLKRLHPRTIFYLHNEGELSPVEHVDSLNRCVVISWQKSADNTSSMQQGVEKGAISRQLPATEASADSPDEMDAIGSNTTGTIDSLHPNEILVKKFALQNILFEPDRAILMPPSVYTVEQTAKLLSAYNGYSFEVRGHVNFTADLRVEPGTPPFELSINRAKLVKQLLIQYGLPADKITARGMGNSELIYPYPQNLEEKLKNMRVEVLIYKPKKK